MTKGQNNVRLFLVDDHEMVRTGLRLVIQAEVGLQVVGESSDGQDVLVQLEALNPDVILMDIQLPMVDGIALSRQILSRWPAMKIIVLSALEDRHHLEDALAVGVVGYLHKFSASSELIRAIRAVSKGQTYFSSQVASALVDGYRSLLTARHQSEVDRISDRETEVLKLVAEGLSTKEIAHALGLSIKTIETHRLSIMSKLNLHNVADLTKYAIRHGLASL